LPAQPSALHAWYFQPGQELPEWTFTGTKSDGTRVEVTGCDLFTFKNGKIAVNNSYRKYRVLTK